MDKQVNPATLGNRVSREDSVSFICASGLTVFPLGTLLKTVNIKQW